MECRWVCRPAAEPRPPVLPVSDEVVESPREVLVEQYG
jgi:hypothetical protein